LGDKSVTYDLWDRGGAIEEVTITLIVLLIGQLQNSYCIL